MGNALGGVTMAKIESVKDLPEWFDLEKYKDCESFGALEWYVEVRYRQRIRNIFNAPNKIFRNGAGEAATREAEKLRETPIGHGGENDYYVSRFEMPIIEITTTDLMLQSTYDKTLKTIGDCGLPLLDRWGWIADVERHGSGIPLALHTEPLRITSYPHGTVKPCIMVELSAPDAVLKEAFSAWLNEAREAATGSSAPSRNKLAYGRWGRYGLLPYLDLQLWEIETGNQIPDRVMSAALSRNGHDAGENFIRQTLAPLANKLMQDLSALNALAAVEAAE